MDHAPTSLFRQFWKLVWPYWKSEEKYKAIGLFILSCILSLAFVWATVAMNKITLGLYNALEKKNYAEFIHQLYLILLAIVCIASMFSIRVLVTNLLDFNWRQWLTNKSLDKWSRHDLYYRVLLKKDKPDNPDQRISQDIASLSSLSINLTFELLTQVVSLCSFSVILWQISSSMPFQFAGHTYHIPGHLLLCTLLYAGIGTLLGWKIGKPLIPLDVAQERFEANFRYSLVRLQEKREEVALFNGKESELKIIQTHFASIRSNFLSITRRSCYLTLYRNFYINLDQFIPLVLATPMYFSSLITLGVLMQIRSAFNTVVGSLSILVEQFNQFASLSAAVTRLSQFNEFVDTAEHDMANSKISIDTKGQRLVVHNLSLSTPTNKPLLKGVKLDVAPGDRVLLTGQSGIGKSTLVRAICGLWAYGQGKISVPQADVFFVPQRPYMPIMKLRDTISYPSSKQVDDQELSKWLDVFKLSHLKEHLDDSCDWSTLLSLGEQQRVSFIRLLVNKPSWIVMDEPTSSLNPELAELAFNVLFQELKDSTFVTVSHVKALSMHHSKVVDVNKWRCN